MKRIAILAFLGVISLGALSSSAADATNPFHDSLSHVTAAELPPKAAELVKNVKSREREATTINVVKAAVEINPAAAPAIVGAIARASQDVAAAAAGTAAAAQPRQAGAIAKAASAAAPSKAGKIVVAVCRAVPSEYMTIASAVAQAVPGAAREILEAVATALPELKPSIERALAGYRGLPSVATVLSDAAKIAPSITAAPTTPTLASSPVSAGTTPVASPTSSRGPAVGPPYIPLSGTPGTGTPGTSGDVPTGGRNYAAP